MALSNWDTAAFDTEGKPSVGEIKIDDLNFTIYKNWLSVARDLKGEFHKSVASINHGNLTLEGVEIFAERGPQQSVFVYIYNYGDNEIKFAGIGCYGFLDDLENIKRNYPQTHDEIKHTLLAEDEEIAFTGYNKKYLTLYILPKDKESKKKSREVKINLPEGADLDATAWVGVEQPTMDKFIEWLKEIDEEYAAKINVKEILRYNQGDAFFADHGGIDIPATEVGTPSTPILIQALKEDN